MIGIGIGIGHAIDFSSWRILFYGNIPKHQEGGIIGIYEATMQIMYGLSIVIAGFIGELYGFNRTLLFAGLITLSSKLILFLIRNSSVEM